MKKIISVLILVAAVCMLCTGTAFAATTGADGQTFYIATDDITVYVRSTDGSYPPALIIPESYYFKVKSNGSEYTEIVYAKSDLYSGIQLFIKTTDFESKSDETSDPVTETNYYYEIKDPVPQPVNDDVYFLNPGTYSDEMKSKYVKIDKIIGTYQDSGNAYFTAIVTISDQKLVLMFRAIDSNRPSFTLSSIPLHEITIDRNNAENEGVISTPTDGTGETGQNNVIRNVMIAIICIMCVIVIFLIFRPTKNAKNRYEMDNRENADNGKYGDNNRRYDDERYDSGRR